MTPPNYTLLFAAALTGAAFLTFSPAKSHASAGDLYDADFNNGTIYQFNAAGVRTTFASGMSGPIDVAFDQAGDLYAADYHAGTIFKITPAGTKTAFATGLNHPQALAFDSAGNLFVVENYTNSFTPDKDIVKITPTGTKTVFAGGLTNPRGLAFDASGNLFVSDSGGPAFAILKFTPTGTKTTFATPSGFPRKLALSRQGDLYLGAGDTIEKYTPDGTKTIFASAPSPNGLTFDAAGNLFASSSPTNKIFKFAPDGTQTVFVSSYISAPQGLAVEPARGKSLNIATRLNVQTGENVLIGGFIITGTGGKSVVIRGIGPSLASAGVQGALQDPIIELHYPGGFFNTNDNWRDTQASQIQATGLAPTDDRESAITYNLSPGNYTVVMKGKNNSTGIGLIEVYDILQSAGKLANISTRGQVGTGANVMIGGFILGGNGARVIVRGIGPSLGSAGIAGALSDPKLSLRNANGAEIATNNNWKETQASEIQATGIPPNNDLEAAIVATLPNGNYTAILEGVNGATGVGLVEVYNIQ